MADQQISLSSAGSNRGSVQPVSLKDVHNLLVANNEMLAKIHKLLMEQSFRNEAHDFVLNSMPVKSLAEMEAFNKALLKHKRVVNAFVQWVKTASFSEVLTDDALGVGINFSGRCGKVALNAQKFYTLWKGATSANDIDLDELAKKKFDQVRNKMNGRQVRAKKKRNAALVVSRSTAASESTMAASGSVVDENRLADRPQGQKRPAGGGAETSSEESSSEGEIGETLNDEADETSDD